MIVLVAQALAAPSQQQITYDLALNGEKIGTREVTVRWIPRDTGERRVVESFTTLTAAGTSLAARASGASSATGGWFASAVQQGDVVYQVQGTDVGSGNWRVIVVDGDGPDEKTVPAALSTLDLHDPVRARALDAPGPVGLVVVETGEVISGAVVSGIEGTIKVGGESIPVTRYMIDAESGKAKFDLDSNGTLLRSEIHWLGGTVVATARGLPPPRSFGETETIEKMEAGVEETAL